MKTKITPNIEYINNTLILNTSFIDNIGLMHGKMGICIYFYHLAHKTRNKTYENYAGELIDEIYEEINTNTPLDFENGLAGIGWGIEYLVQNKFIDADTDDILAELDEMLYKKSLNSQVNDISLLTGMIGLGTYFLMRFKNSNSSDNKTPKRNLKHYLILLIDSTERMLTDNSNILKEPKAFDITWDYPVLLLFLANLHSLNIYNHKVEIIINKLIVQSQEINDFPKLFSNHLFLAYALSKVYEFYHLPIINNLSTKLFESVNLNAIYLEIHTNNSIRYGKSGITLITKKIPEYVEQWDMLKYDSSFTDKILISKDNTNYGILEGLTGALLTS